MLGGIVLTRDLIQLDFQRLHIPKGLAVTIIRPELRVLTAEARSILKSDIALKKAIRQSANLAALVLAFERSDYTLLRDSMQDLVIEPQRAHLIPGFESVKAAAFGAGALTCGISGSGPALFAFAQNTLIAESVGLAMQSAFAEHNTESTVAITSVQRHGVVLH